MTSSLKDRGCDGSSPLLTIELPACLKEEKARSWKVFKFLSMILINVYSQIKMCAQINSVQH